MKKFLEKSFSISLVFGGIAVALCIPAMNHAIFMLLALAAGFIGFVLSCLYILLTQRFNLPVKPGSLMILSLFLNSVPLIYMMYEISQHTGGR
jgi:hypothetical protein